MSTGHPTLKNRKTVDKSPTQLAAEEPPTATAIYALSLLALVNAFSNVDRSALALVLPQIKADLHLTDTTLGLISGLPFALCFAACTVPAAWIADNWSRRNLITIGFAFWSGVMVLSGLVTTGPQLAAARFLLGAGESTGLPSSTSMIADMFRTRFRAIAFSVLATSPFIGLLLGFPVVGWVAQHHGWRMAFVAAGAPGILLGALFFLTVKEPERRTLGGDIKVDRPASFRESAAFLLRSPAYVLILVAGSLGAVNFGSMLAWGPTFLARIHELSLQAAGAVFGGARGIAGLVGAMSAGVIVNALARNNENWRVWAPAIAATLLFPVDAIFLYAPGILVAQSALAIDAFLSAALVAATYTLYIGVAKARMRGVASALYFLVANLTGLTFGPFIVGYFNDQMSAQLGPAAIRYSMLFAASFAMWTGLALFLTSRYWSRDVSRAFDH